MVRSRAVRPKEWSRRCALGTCSRRASPSPLGTPRRLAMACEDAGLACTSTPGPANLVLLLLMPLHSTLVLPNTLYIILLLHSLRTARRFAFGASEFAGHLLGPQWVANLAFPSTLIQFGERCAPHFVFRASCLDVCCLPLFAKSACQSLN